MLESTLFHDRQEKNNISFYLKADELMHFFGIILLSGCHSVRSDQILRSNRQDLGVPMVSEALSLGRFLQIKSALYLVDSTTLAINTDKMAKINFL